MHVLITNACIFRYKNNFVFRIYNLLLLYQSFFPFHNSKVLYEDILGFKKEISSSDIFYVLRALVVIFCSV